MWNVLWDHFPSLWSISFKSSLCESLLVNNHFFLSSPTVLLPQMPLCHLGAILGWWLFLALWRCYALSVGMKSVVFHCCYEVSCQYYFFVCSRWLSLISFKISYLILSLHKYLLMVIRYLVLLPVMEPWILNLWHSWNLPLMYQDRNFFSVYLAWNFFGFLDFLVSCLSSVLVKS